MEIKRLSDTLIEVVGPGGTARVECGPVRRREVATEELLSNERTASHYYAGVRKRQRPVWDKERRRYVNKEVSSVGRDAVGKKIELGKPFEFIDWKSKERSWTVYLEQDAPGKKAGTVVRRFMPQGTHASEEAALSQATTLVTTSAA